MALSWPRVMESISDCYAHEKWVRERESARNEKKQTMLLTADVCRAAEGGTRFGGVMDRRHGGIWMCDG
jgi:hypothetical protein